MKLFARSLFLLSLVPALAGASSGTIHFRGALVAPTCQAEVLDTAAALPRGRVTVRLYDCRIPPTPPQPSPVGAEPHHLTGATQALTLSPSVAELAGRAQVDMLTFSYE